MKVIYRVTVLQRIERAEAEAAEQGKTIERIELTPDEFDELIKGSVWEKLVPDFTKVAGFRGHRCVQFRGYKVTDYPLEVEQ